MVGLVFCDDGRVDAAAYIKLGAQPHKTRGNRRHQVIENPIGDGLMKRPLIPKRPDIALERLEFYAKDIGHIIEIEGCEIGLAGLWAETGKFRYADVNSIVPRWGGVLKGLERGDSLNRHKGLAREGDRGVISASHPG